MKALIIVDVQNDFLPQGALAVSNGDEVVPIINDLQTTFDLVVATQDWHPQDHQSFASNHSLGKIGQLIDLHGLQQILWPDHCVQYTQGAQFAADLDQTTWDKVFQKGTEVSVDSYSGFYDNGRRKDTGLSEYLRSKNVDEVFVVGLATDYCVKYTALDAVSEGFKTWVVVDAVRAVNLNPEDGSNSLLHMQQQGVKLISSSDLIKN